MEKIIQELEKEGYIMALEFTGKFWNGKCGDYCVEGEITKEGVEKKLIELILCGRKD